MMEKPNVCGEARAPTFQTLGWRQRPISAWLGVENSNRAKGVAERQASKHKQEVHERRAGAGAGGMARGRRMIRRMAVWFDLQLVTERRA